MSKSYKPHIYLFTTLFFLLSFFTTSARADTYWAPNGNDIYKTNSGNVGIGTTAPSFPLEVSGTYRVFRATNPTSWVGIELNAAAGYDSNLYFREGGYDKYRLQWDASENYFKFHDSSDNSTDLVIEPSGDIGVGTTSPDTDFEIEGSQDILRVTDPSSYAVMQINAASGYDSGLDYMENGDVQYSLNWDASADTFKFINKVGASIAQMVINGSGYVGIGTESPSKLLDVVGEAKFDGALFARDATGIGFKDASGNLGLWTEDGGQVGIGTSSPGAPLDIADVVSSGSPLVRVGDDVFFTDLDQTGTLGLYSTTDGSGKIKFGSGGATVGSKNGSGAFRVDATLIAKEIYVQSDVWADYVFDDGYYLTPLGELEQYIDDNGHLPGVPTTEEITEEGINVAEMNKILLQKIEELTLYSIDLQKQIDDIKTSMNTPENVCR